MALVSVVGGDWMRKSLVISKDIEPHLLIMCYVPQNRLWAVHRRVLDEWQTEWAGRLLAGASGLLCHFPALGRNE